MPVDVIGIDHIYLAVASLERSQPFYDAVLVEQLGFRKNSFALHEQPHVQYYNRHFGIVLRPASAAQRAGVTSPGLHHLCLQVDSAADVAAVATALRAGGIEATAPRTYPEYAADYVATFFTDPDGIRLEVTNFRQERRRRMEHWESAAAPPGASRGKAETGDE
ncbi:MAG: VOC family protein [bacterium]